MSSKQIQDPVPGEAFTGNAGSEGAPEGAPSYSVGVPQGTKLGFWLDEPDEQKVAKDVVRRWKAQDKASKSRSARWDCNTRRRDGDQYSKLKYDPDTGECSLYVPLGAENAPPSLNKTDALCTKMVANLLVDPPRPDAEPPSDSDEDRAAAEFTTRVLLDLHSESGLGMDETLREAEELACTHGSGFVRYFVDPHAGGQRPKDIMAGFDPETGEKAQSEADALFRPAMDMQPAIQGAIDTAEQTSAPTEAPAPPAQSPWPAYELRYVAPEGALTDNPAEAEIVWLPKIRREILTGKHVRFLPDTASSIKDAEGVIIAGFVQVGTLKRLFEERMKTMAVADIEAMVKHRPEQWKTLLPKHVGMRAGTEEKRTDGQEGPPDDALVLVYTLYYLDCPDYPRGAYVVIGGDKFVLERTPTSVESEDSEGKTALERMDLPVAQFRQFMDTTSGDPYGRGLVDKIGDGDPLLALAIGYLVEYVYRANNPMKFVAIGSGITDKTFQLPRSTVVPFNPVQGTPVVFEQIPPFAAATMELHDRIDSYMNDRSGLHEVAQGESTPEVKSGKHARIIVEQALVALSGAMSALKEGFVRSCRIQSQLIRAHYTTPQKVKITGEDGAYKVQEWTKADLGSTKDVKIASGTATMLSPSAKAAVASEQLEIALARQDARGVDQYYRALSGNTNPILGLQDDPAALEVKRSIAAWAEGPPEGFDQAFAEYQMAMQQFQMVQMEQQQLAMQGQPVQQMQPPALPMNPFQPRPNHNDPFVAKVRYDELSRSMSGTKYAKQAPEWRVLFDQEYERMRQAAGVATVAEQQAAAQQQAQMEAEAKGQQMGAQSAEKDKERAFRGAESEKDREATKERDAQKTEIAAMRAA